MYIYFYNINLRVIVAVLVVILWYNLSTTYVISAYHH